MEKTRKLNKNRKKKILVTGKNSRFCKFLKHDLKNYKTYFTDKKNFNILNFKQMNNFLKKKKIDYLIHVAGLSRPMSIHDEKIELSINLNIIGTANIVKLCKLHAIKLIYFSTNYVYECKKGNYKETDNLKPINSYSWSKLGGEASVHLYKNSLILRLSMTDYPFSYNKAIVGAYSNFLYNKDVSKIIPHIIDEYGILNIGGKRREIYQFAKISNSKKIEKLHFKKVKDFPKDSSLNIKKLSKILDKSKLRLN